jgi:ElaB/YqjD/DUF883 family membrane-anchored ribosome-binding protein
MAEARNRNEARSLLEQPAVQEQIDRVRNQLDDLDTRVRRAVREQPLLAVGSALVVGYVLARLLARR